MVGLLVTELVYETPLRALPRVEIRQCETPSGTLQLLAWEPRATSPTLVIDTTDLTIVQSVARGNTYVIETTGGPRDRVYVIQYEDGRPKLRLMRVTKGTATITVGQDSIQLVISGIYAGDAKPLTETYRYALR